MFKCGISVIIPVFNGESYLTEAIESVAWQTVPPIEIIVVDDGSQDCSAAIAASFPGVTCLRQANGGVAGARNAGVAAAKGDTIAFLDADDTWLPDKLERQLPALSGGGLVTCLQRTQLSGGLTASPAWFRAGALGEPVVCNEPSSWLLARRTWEAVGPLDPGFRLAEDWEWLARLRRAGIRTVCVENVLLLRRLHRSNLSHDVAGARAAVFRVLRQSTAAPPAGSA